MSKDVVKRCNVCDVGFVFLNVHDLRLLQIKLIHHFTFFKPKNFFYMGLKM